MDPSTTGSEREVDTERTPPPASRRREESRNPTANATTMTKHEEKDSSTADEADRRKQYPAIECSEFCFIL
jgi:hypothetical protein